MIIKDIHGALAKSNSDKDVKNEAKMTQIEKILFGFEFSKELSQQWCLGITNEHHL